ncbi:hypothetical protein CEXT_351761 [Caerostris extrusa]|uniref:Uncharacterized protein n=1 Tax=Caerostris extrusa TaxID=172846 RepID=A0AAV4RU36_CAEEX|nr:hypothetical protein CEXT_351761 [Caerostris extrusa]
MTIERQNLEVCKLLGQIGYIDASISLYICQNNPSSNLLNYRAFLLQSGSAQDSPTNPNELPTRSPLLAPRLHSKHVFLAKGIHIQRHGERYPKGKLRSDNDGASKNEMRPSTTDMAGKERGPQSSKPKSEFQRR